jgi:ATP phosphoribosyltransferase
MPVEIRVVRPQDMPLHVANGHFDVAITGEDWLAEHRTEFPTSRVDKLCSLGHGRVRICAVAHNDLAIGSVGQLVQLCVNGKLPNPYVRVASEYVALADNYCRTHHVPRYRVIPTWGSTEAYLPDDADMIIENAQTGRTLAQNNLRVFDVLFESTACVIAHPDSVAEQTKRGTIAELVAGIQSGVLSEE